MIDLFALEILNVVIGSNLYPKVNRPCQEFIETSYFFYRCKSQNSC